MKRYLRSHMFSHRLMAAVLVACCGCMTGADLRTRAQVPLGPNEVAVQFSFLENGKTAWKPLWPDDVLHSGDELSLRIEAGGPFYIYAVRAPAGGAMQDLYANQAG